MFSRIAVGAATGFIAAMTEIPQQGTAEYFRFRAEEARADADGMTDPDMRQTLLNIAASYVWMATFATRRERKEGRVVKSLASTASRPRARAKNNADE